MKTITASCLSIASIIWRRRALGSLDWLSKESAFCALAEIIQANRINRYRMILRIKLLIYGFDVAGVGVGASGGK